MIVPLALWSDADSLPVWLPDATRSTVIAGMLVQALGQLLLAGICYAAYRSYRRNYLALLAASWLALAVHQGNGAMTLAYGAGTSVPELVARIAGGLAGYAQIVWLVLGVHGLTCGHAITRRAFLTATALATVLALVGFASTASPGSPDRLVVQAGVRDALAAVALLVAATHVLTRRHQGFGRWLVAGGFGMYATDLLQYAALMLPGRVFEPSLHLGYVDILAQMIAGLGLVVVMLEDERERATTAVAVLQSTHDQHVHSSKMEALGRMAGGVSHDFNNLLTAMRGHLELALERTEPADARRVDLEQAWRAAERACHLTQQLLSFSRARTAITHDPCDLVNVLREVKPLLHRLVGPTIDIVYDVPERAVLVGIDRTALEQVIFNLAANARDAMPNGGALTVQVHTRPGDAGEPAVARLRVSDSGCGMDDATKAKIFDPFFTTKPPGQGTGLGLALVYGIVQQACGKVECSSTPGAGAAFAIELPLSDLPFTSPPKAAEPPAAIPLDGTMRDEVIMLVDDDPLVRQLLCRSLREHGYTVIEAGDAIDALALETEFDEAIDLLITDLAMPRLSGIELASRICERRPAVRVLFISGYSATHTPSPDVELLEKPFSQTTFLAHVEKLLAARRTTRAEKS